MLIQDIMLDGSSKKMVGSRKPVYVFPLLACVSVKVFEVIIFIYS